MNNKISQVFRIRPFFFLWLSEVFSQIAMNMVNFVLLIVAFNLSQANSAVSGIVLSFTIPSILFGVIAGVLVDRWNKKKVLFATNAIRTLLLLSLAVFHDNLLFIYLLAFSVSVVTQFFIPAETPMIPLIVRKELLLTANAFFGLGIYGSVVIAYAISGPLLLIFKDVYIFVILAMFFAIAALFAWFIKTPDEILEAEIKQVSSEEKEIAQGIIGELRTALFFIVKTKEILHALFLLAFSQVLILVLAVIGPGFALEILRVGVNEFPLYFITPAALGMITGAIVLIYYFHNSSREKSATIGVFLSGISILLLPFASHAVSKAFIVVLAFVLGFANALIFVPSNTILQEKTEDSFRGKMYGVLNSLIGMFSLFPIILVGQLADYFGIAKVLTGIGVCIVGVGIYRVIPRFRRKKIFYV